MKWTSLNDLREKYLSFFESKGHLRLQSFSLVPNGDKSLLLINSGMAPMKKFFTGEVVPPRNRVTTCQKCIRTPDLERVGHTARHGSFFEMLGNFSFGDYFKNEAIPWAWEFLTSDEWLAIPKEKLWPSVYEEDEETFRLWHEVIGIPADRITRLGKEDNFWEHGTGPCGPCSEIYFDRGEKYGCGRPDCRPGCDCDRFMEIWNNVFSQFNSDGKGNYTELTHKNIDTGMGLERLACVMQGVDNMFEVDSIRKILDTVCSIANKKYGDNTQDDISIRVITDHIRSSMFMISDGVIPSNEGRGYVLRRIIRRACRHGKLLGINHSFLCDVCRVAIGESCGAYPELQTKSEYILKVLSLEEERFDVTIDAGLSMLQDLVQEAKKQGKTTLDGGDIFKLYDTYGFPFDLSSEMAKEEGLDVDEASFKQHMEEQRTRARQARGNISGWANTEKSILSELPKTQFLGYTQNSTDATILAILTDNGPVDEITEGDCTIICDKTVFYGEGGGQVGDTGSLTKGAVSVEVLDTKKTDGIYMHICHVTDGHICVKDTVTLTIDVLRREAIRRNHSACHLLQAALRTVLGTHVEQAGSYVDPERVRFDFTHFAAVTKEELAEVERLVNIEILKAAACSTEEKDIEEARKLGAMMLFDEKYGKTVRVVSIGESSLEFCGGTHVSNTGNIGLFRIISESSVAAGVRRIEGVTGLNVLTLLEEKEQLMQDTAKVLRAGNVQDLAKRAQALEDELKEAHRKQDQLNSELSAVRLNALLDAAKDVAGFKVLTATLQSKPDEARAICDLVKGKYANAVAVFACIFENKLNFVACCGTEAVKAGAHAGNILKEVSAITGGRGGGRPDFAMSGGQDLTKVDAALAHVETLLGK